jgi:hypothetical protein
LNCTEVQYAILCRMLERCLKMLQKIISVKRNEIENIDTSKRETSPVTLRLTVSLPYNLRVKLHLVHKNRFLLLSDTCSIIRKHSVRTT